MRSGINKRLLSVWAILCLLTLAYLGIDQSADEHERILASVEEDKNKILASAEQEIASATALARRQIQQYAAELAIDQAARKLVVSAETDSLLVQNFARRLGVEEEGKS